MLLLLIVLILIFLGLAFTKIDCDIYLWFIDKFSGQPKNLNGKVVWITGASSGIGEYMAYELARCGCRLALSGRNESRLANVKQQCLDASSIQEQDILILPFEIHDFNRHKACMERVLNHFKKIDILINNAGRSQRAAFEQIELSVDIDMFNVNVFGPVNLTRLVLNHWFKQKAPGHVVVTSSAAGVMGAPFSSTYCATKFSLHGYFDTLRNETFLKNIKVTLLCPGPVFSNILQNSFTAKEGVVMNQSHSPDSRRMSTQRCARLCLVAIAYQVNEGWISIQPVLTFMYLTRYLPSLFSFGMSKFMTEDKIRKIREGK